MKTICVDFDGVIHSYVSPWQAAEIIPDPPVPGAFDFLTECLDASFRVVILTSRMSKIDKDTGLDRDPVNTEIAIQNWFERWGFKDTINLVFSNEKCAAVLYIDDRGYHFTGNNFPRLDYIKTFKPWNR